MLFKIEVRRQDFGSYQFFLQYVYEIEEILGLSATDVIDGIGGNGETILASLALRSSLHHAHNALDDIIDIGEVTTAVAVVEDFYRLALEQLIRKAEVSHIGTSCRTIDGEEAQACGGDIVELRVAMGEELVRAGVLPKDYDFDAHKELVPMQPGDVPVTYADATALEKDFGFTPKITLREGLRKFATWYKEYYT